MHPLLARDVVVYTVAFGLLLWMHRISGIPDILSGAPALVNEYYGKRWLVYALDWLLVAIYIYAGAWIARFADAELWVGSAMAALFISGGFFIYFVSKPVTTGFFSRWFHKAGVGAVLYDIMIVSSTAWFYSILQDLVRPPRGDS